MRALLALLALLLLAGPAAAVSPGEVLDNPVLEARAREISQGLRCPVCRNESIDESGASVAADLRLLLRERLLAGDSDAEAVDFLVARYGEFILLRPDAEGANLLLWLAGPLLLLGGAGAAAMTIRRGRSAAVAAPLTETEARDVAALMKEES